jgi:hypothetical protein
VAQQYTSAINITAVGEKSAPLLYRRSLCCQALAFANGRRGKEAQTAGDMLEKGGWWGSNALVARVAYHHFEDTPTYHMTTEE